MQKQNGFSLNSAYALTARGNKKKRRSSAEQPKYLRGEAFIILEISISLPLSFLLAGRNHSSNGSHAVLFQNWKQKYLQHNRNLKSLF